jgi:transcriptional regulator with XRE-family HTH domain
VNKNPLIKDALTALLVRTAKPLKSQEIARTLSRELGFSILKGDVNSVLYGMMTSGLAVRDKEIRWTAVGGTQPVPVSTQPQRDTGVGLAEKKSTPIRRGRPSTVTIDANGLLGTAVADGLDAKGMTLRNLALKTGLTYDHVRRIVKGLAHPATPNLKRVCKAVGLDYPTMQKALMQDKMQSKSGDTLSAATNRDQVSVAFDELTAQLTLDEASWFMKQMRSVINERKKL